MACLSSWPAEQADPEQEGIGSGGVEGLGEQMSLAELTSELDQPIALLRALDPLGHDP